MVNSLETNAEWSPASAVVATCSLMDGTGRQVTVSLDLFDWIAAEEKPGKLKAWPVGSNGLVPDQGLTHSGCRLPGPEEDQNQGVEVTQVFRSASKA